MKRSSLFRQLVAFGVAAAIGQSALAETRQMEKLDRGVVAVQQADGGVFVGWRLLTTDAADSGFDVYRADAGKPPVKLNAAPLAGPTHFVDSAPGDHSGSVYSVRPVGTPATTGDSFTLPAGGKPYLSIPLQTPAGYKPNDASVADLDGDGQYEIILHQEGRAKDNSQAGVTDPPILQAYTLAGKLLWQINLGRNIRDGAHYTQFLCYDLDGDGRAEVVCKTADGTVDGTGKTLGDPTANYVNDRGFILSGPEKLTVFDGRTGAAIDTVDYVPNRVPEAPTLTPTTQQMTDTWGDAKGNRMDRFLACVAYLDGVHPSVVFARGYYTRTVLAAFDFKGGKLQHRWTFDSNKEGKQFAGQGNHNLSVADVDDDGKDEIVYGGMVVDDNGRGLFSTGYGHGDAIHVGDLDPANPGLEMFRIQERFDDAGLHMVSLKTGQTLWKKPSLDKSQASKFQGPGRGLAADIDPRHGGFECWAMGAGVHGLWDAQGNLITEKLPTLTLAAGQSTFGQDADAKPRTVKTCNFRVYWDGDTLDELLDQNQIVKWDWEKEETRPLLVADGCVANNGTKANPTLSADILGDWREEVIWPTADGQELRLYTTTIPTDIRMPTLMSDPQYRLSVAWQNVGYNQPPHLGHSIAPAAK